MRCDGAERLRCRGAAAHSPLVAWSVHAARATPTPAIEYDMPAASIALTASPASVIADGMSTSTITVLVTDVVGDPVPDGEPIAWFHQGSGVVNPRVATTLAGHCEATATPAPSSSAGDLTVLCLAVRTGLFATIRVDCVPPLTREPDTPLWDIFVSHASEDKEAVARPLAGLLVQAGLRVWLDADELRLGDSLSQKIDEGLAQCRYGVVVLSPAFFAKHWPRQELSALIARESSGRKLLLPVWHGVDKAFIMRFSPILADRLGVDSARGLPIVAGEIVRAAYEAST